MAREGRVAKTNAMRELDRAGVAYEVATYDVGDDVPGHDLGVMIARELGEDPESAFKTLVCETPSGGHVVCCIPVGDELDLKKAARAAGEKSLAMMHVRDLEATTGYVRGACSPVGMRRAFPTLVNDTALLFDRIGISGGRRGTSLLVDPEQLVGFVGGAFADIVRDGR